MKPIRTTNGNLEKIQRQRRELAKVRLRQNPELVRQLLEQRKLEKLKKQPLYQLSIKENFLFDKQIAFVEDPNRTKALLTSRRAGKTTVLGYCLLDAILRNPGMNVPFISFTRESGKLIIVPIISELCEKLGITYKVHQALGDISFPATKNKILVRGLDNSAQTNKLRGNKFPFVAIDECQNLGADLKEFIEEVIEPCLLDTGGTVVLAGTPGEVQAGPFYEITTGRIPGWSIHEWTLLDNPYLLKDNPHFSNAHDVLEDVKKKKGWTDETPSFIREYLGKWTQEYDYKVFQLGVNNIIDLSKNSQSINDEFNTKDWEYGLGVDLGYDSDSAYLVVKFSRDLGVVLVVDEYSQKAMTNGDHFKKILELEERHGNFSFVVGDSGGYGKSVVESLRREYGVNILSAEKTNKTAAIQDVNDLFKSNRLFVDRACPITIHQLSTLLWYKNALQSGKKLENTKSFSNHQTDALIYCIRTMKLSGGSWEREEPLPGSPEALEVEMEDYWDKIERQIQEEQELEWLF